MNLKKPEDRRLILLKFVKSYIFLQIFSSNFTLKLKSKFTLVALKFPSYFRKFDFTRINQKFKTNNIFDAISILSHYSNEKEPEVDQHTILAKFAVLWILHVSLLVYESRMF